MHAHTNPPTPIKQYKTKKPKKPPLPPSLPTLRLPLLPNVAPRPQVPKPAPLPPQPLRSWPTRLPAQHSSAVVPPGRTQPRGRRPRHKGRRRHLSVRDARDARVLRGLLLLLRCVVVCFCRDAKAEGRRIEDGMCGELGGVGTGADSDGDGDAVDGGVERDGGGDGGCVPVLELEVRGELLL